MMPGPKIIFQCPQCGRKVINDSLRSGNTFGAVLYSDGYLDATMLPPYPSEVKCKKCGGYFDLNEACRIGELGDDFELCDHNIFLIYKGAVFGASGKSTFTCPNVATDELEVVDKATSLSVEDYREKIALSIGNEIENRLKIWREENGHFPWGGPVNHDDASYRENCNRLIVLLHDTQGIDNRIALAELNRNVGNFDACMDIIEKLPAECDWLKSMFTKKCNKRETEVFILRGKY